MPHAEARDGTALHYTDWGTGPAVVLIHGWPLSADMWEHQAVFLAENGVRVIAYDRRGFGRSGQPWTGYDYDTFADDLAAVLETTGADRAALVGFSMGGGEVARYLSRHGAQRVPRVALVSAVTPYLLKGPTNPDGADKSLFDGMIDGLRQDRPHFLAGFGKKFYGVGPLTFSISSEFLEWNLDIALQASPQATLACVRAFSETDFRPDMAAFTVPTLVVHGDADETVPLAISGQKAAAAIPGAELKVYGGAPHGLHYTHREQLNADLLAFLR